MDAERAVFGWLRVGSASWELRDLGIPSAGARVLLGSVLEALVGSAAGLARWYAPPTWVAAVAVAQEHGALFYFGFGPVQGRGKMLLVQNSDMVPRQLSRKLWDIRISLRVGRDEGTHVAQVLRGSLAYPGGTYHPGAGPRVQGLLGRQGSTVEGTKEHTTGG